MNDKIFNSSKNIKFINYKTPVLKEFNLSKYLVDEIYKINK